MGHRSCSRLAGRPRRSGTTCALTTWGSSRYSLSSRVRRAEPTVAQGRAGAGQGGSAGHGDRRGPVAHSCDQ
eukprot:8463926-Pyramimonas_sp.AAC.1